MTVETYVQPAIDSSVVVAAETAAQFAPHAQETPDMTVRVDAGRVFDTSSKKVTEVAAQNTATITAPSTNPRNDIVYVDRASGTVGVTTGAEAASPVDPAIPSGKAPVARINLTTSTTEIGNANLDDLRVSVMAIPGPFGTSAKLDADNVVLNRLEIAAQHNLSAGNLVDGMFDAFTDETGVDTATSTNETYDAAADSYDNDPTGVFGSDLATSGQAISDSEFSTAYDDGAFADDGATTRWASAIQSPTALTGAGYIGQDFGGGTTYNIRRVAVQQHWALSGNRLYGTDVIKIQRSDDGSAWTDVDTISPINNALMQTFDIADGGTHRYWRFLADAEVPNWGGGAVWTMVEAEMKEPAPATDLTLLSNAFTAQNQPEEVDVTMLWEEIDAVTLNTDLLLDISRDGGTTFTTATLVDRGTYVTPKEVLTATVDVSGQPAGTSVKWRIRTDNEKSVKIHGVGLTWS